MISLSQIHTRLSDIEINTMRTPQYLVLSKQSFAHLLTDYIAISNEIVADIETFESGMRVDLTPKGLEDYLGLRILVSDSIRLDEFKILEEIRADSQ